MSGAIEGEGGAYVPCGCSPAPLPDDPAGAIVGSDVGFVARDELAAGMPDDPAGAIVGSDVGFVAKPCCECGTLAGSSGLVDLGSAVSGTHTVIQSSGLTLTDGLARTIPYVDSPASPGPFGEWYQWGVADTGQQWWHSGDIGSVIPPPPNVFELDGTSVLLTGWLPPGIQSGGRINLASAGGYGFEYYDFGWRLADLGFDAYMDLYFEKFGLSIIDHSQWAMTVQVASANQASFSTASVQYRVRRSTDVTQLFMGRGGSPTVTVTIPPLLANTWYRVHWQVDGPSCNSRARIWEASSSEPGTWDGETTLLAPMQPNAAFGATAIWSGSVDPAMPQTVRLRNVSLMPLNLDNCWGSVCEDSVTQIGPRQYQLKNSYLPSTIVAFVGHSGYPLVKYSRSQAVPNIVEDDPAAGIFSFPASISYDPVYNPTITTGTIVTACYIVPAG